MQPDPLDPLGAQEFLAQILKYAGILMTTALGIYALRIETVDKTNQPYHFTRTGMKYLWWLVGLTIFTSSVTAWDDHIDKQIKQIAEDKGNIKLREQLFQNLLPELKKQQDLMTASTVTFTNAIDTATVRLDKSVGASSKKLTATINESTESLATAGVPLDRVILQIGPARPIIHGVRPEWKEVENVLSIWNDYYERHACTHRFCKRYSDLYKSFVATSGFLEQMWNAEVEELSYDMTFRGFAIGMHIHPCLVWRPAPKDGILSDIIGETAPPFPCVEVGPNRTNQKMKSQPDFPVLNGEYITEIGIAPFKDDAEVMNADTALQGLEVTVCSSDAKGLKIAAGHILTQPLHINVHKKLKGTGSNEDVYYSASPGVHRGQIEIDLSRNWCSTTEYHTFYAWTGR